MNKLTAIFALSSLCALTACSEARESYKDVDTRNGETQPLGQCFDSEGVQVRLRVQRVPNPMLQHGWGAFSEYTPMSGPMVTFQNMEGFDAEIVEFTWEHECAHHELGHAREVFDRYIQGDMSIPANAHQYELDADCRAVQTMHADGRLDETELHRVFAQFPESEHSQTHPSRMQRLNNALQCLIK